MYRSVTMYETQDGKKHATTASAKRHAINLLCQQVENLLTHAHPGFNRPGTYAAVERLLGDKAKTQELLQQILDSLAYDDEGDDQ